MIVQRKISDIKGNGEEKKSKLVGKSKPMLTV